MIEHWVGDVGLHDSGLGLAVWMCFLLQKFTGDVCCPEDGDTVASVGTLTRLDDPDAALGSLFFILEEE